MTDTTRADLASGLQALGQQILDIMAGSSDFDTVIDAIAMLEADGKRIAELRNILSQCAAAIGNGAVMSPDCSIEFMANLPSEIAAHTDKLRRFLKCSRDEGGEAIARAESAERALAKEREWCAKVADIEANCFTGSRDPETIMMESTQSDCAERIASAIRAGKEEGR